MPSAMKKALTKKAVADWLNATLDVASFDDVSNNGLQIDRVGDGDVCRVAFAVDASLAAVRAAAAAGAQMLVVHHGVSWGGGIRRLTGGVFSVVKAAMDADLAVYACHIPLDAHPSLGNNAQLAKTLGLKRTRPAFAWRGRPIGLVGTVGGHLVGVCSGGAADFAEEAKRLGCDLFVTGEANWGETVAAENCGIELRCLGHYESETGGVRALAAAMKKSLGVQTVDLTKELAPHAR